MFAWRQIWFATDRLKKYKYFRAAADVFRTKFAFPAFASHGNGFSDGKEEAMAHGLPWFFVPERFIPFPLFSVDSLSWKL